MYLLESLLVPFFYLLLIVIQLFIVIIGTYKIYKNPFLKMHQKSFWFFIILASGIIGYLLFMQYALKEKYRNR